MPVPDHPLTENRVCDPIIAVTVNDSSMAVVGPGTVADVTDRNAPSCVPLVCIGAVILYLTRNSAVPKILGRKNNEHAIVCFYVPPAMPSFFESPRDE